MTIDIELVNHEKALQIIESREPLGLFISKDGEKYVAIDNQTGDAWTEEFNSLYVANCCLTGSMDTEEAYKVDDCITQLAEVVQNRELAEYQVIDLRQGERKE